MSFHSRDPIQIPTRRSETTSPPTAAILTLTNSHRCEFEDLLVALDRDSRCSRFGYAASDAALAAHSQNALQSASNTLGIFVQDKLAGAAEIYRCGDTGVYEVSLVVDGPLRKRGLGWRLLSSSMDWARSAKAEGVHLVFSRHNWPMRRLATRACAKFDLSLDEMNAVIRFCSESHRVQSA
jgi:GNAT superfamily N-acetyltransferase